MRKTKTMFQRFDFLDNLEVMIAKDYQQDFPDHFHDELCITLVQKGVECTEVNGFQLLSPVGNISLTHPDEVHANPNLNEGCYSFITYYLSPDFVKYFRRSNHFGFTDRVIENPDLYQKLFHWATRKDTQNSQDLIQIFAQLFRDYFTDSKTEELPASNPKHLDEIIGFMDAHKNEKIALETLAEMAGQSKFSFLRSFKKAKGITPASYLTIKRLEAAKKLLKSGNSIVDATYECGFYDQSHFHKYFKKYHGLTPQQYLKGCNILQD